MNKAIFLVTILFSMNSFSYSGNNSSSKKIILVEGTSVGGNEQARVNAIDKCEETEGTVASEPLYIDVPSYSFSGRMEINYTAVVACKIK